MEKIDILMATYNGAEYVREQIDSILNQTYTDFNLIISDDNSTDNTYDILKEYSKIDKRIILYKQSRNLGYVRNFEFLLNKVSSKFYMLCDQDDVWLPEKIEVYYNKMKDEKLDFVFGDLEIVDKDLNTVSKSFVRKKRLFYKIKKFTDFRLEYLYNCVTGCTIMAKSNLLSKVLPIPKESKYIIHDYWIALNYTLLGNVGFIDKPYIKYRQHENNQVGSRRYSDSLKTFDDIRNLFIDVKIDLFKTYINNGKNFSDELKVMNNNALKYFIRVKSKKNINFKNWIVFHKLYKNERIDKYIIFFLIMNVPIVSKGIYNVIKIIKK